MLGQGGSSMSCGPAQMTGQSEYQRQQKATEHCRSPFFSANPLATVLPSNQVLRDFLVSQLFDLREIHRSGV